MTKDFVLHCDAANSAVGFVLSQFNDGEMAPILYGGRVLTETERRYAIIDKELLSIYYAVKQTEIYLMGHKTIIYTDHKPLIALKSFKDVVNKRFRWISYLEEMGVIIRYIKGAEIMWQTTFLEIRNMIKFSTSLAVIQYN